MPLDKRTRATFRKAEFGFLGVMVLTCRQTPRFCGQACMAGCFGLRYCCRRGFRTSWLIVGIYRGSQGVQGQQSRCAMAFPRINRKVSTLCSPGGLVKGQYPEETKETPSPRVATRGLECVSLAHSVAAASSS